MDTHYILNRLALKQPVIEDYQQLFAIAKPFIMGSESEYGVGQDVDGEPVLDFARLPQVLLNGGEVYHDCGHLEYASPEVSNSAGLVACYEAGKVFCHREKFSHQLFCNNNVWEGNTFAAHENYFTKLPRSQWHRLVPLLVARTVFAGAGWQTNTAFLISQRALFISEVESENTTQRRGIINTRREPLGQVEGYDRLHIICGDATMSEVATFMRFGIVALTLELLELNAFPNIQYDMEFAVSDFQQISRKISDWWLKGITRGSKEALVVLDSIVLRAKELFAGRDFVTNVLLATLEDTITRLGRNPRELTGRIDWVTKLKLLELFANDADGDNPEWLKSQDMAYHDLDPETGLYWFLRDEALPNLRMERLLSNAVIERATFEPPKDTRANARGKIAKFLKQTRGRMMAGGNMWNRIMVSSYHDLADREIVDVDEPTPNPFNPYPEVVERVKAKLKMAIG